ncbi:coiled-coil domain-containing protein 63 [Podargus strigoides]
MTSLPSEHCLPLLVLFARVTKLSLWQQGGPSLRQKLSGLSVNNKEKLAESEMRRLQKKFWIAMDKRKSYGANMRLQMQAQQKEIKLLTQEHEEVSLKLSQIMSLRNSALDDRNSFLSHRSLQVLFDGTRLPGILELEIKIMRQNQRAVKVKQANSSKQLQKQIETLEMQLNNASKHFGDHMVVWGLCANCFLVTVCVNTILTRNYKLREEIRSLQIQKATLDNLYSELDRKLCRQRERMNAAIEQSKEAYKEQYVALQTLRAKFSTDGTQALARISAMKERHSNDTLQYNAELKKWKRVLVKENKLKNFMLTKFTGRSELEEQAKKKRALKAAEWAKQSQAESFESQQVAYKRLLELVENGDIDQLVNGFIEKEDKNFACLSYATELNNEVVNIEQRIQDLQNEIAALMRNHESAESSKLHVLQELEENLTKITEEASEYKNRCKESSKVLGQYLSTMEDLFKEISCDTTPQIQEVTYKHASGSPSPCFGSGCIVEKKIEDLLLKESTLLYTLANDSCVAEPFVSPLLGGTKLSHTMDPSWLCPVSPGMDDTIDDDDAINACECGSLPHPTGYVRPAVGGCDRVAVEAPLDHGHLRQLILQREAESVHHQGREGQASKAPRVIFRHGFAHCWWQPRPGVGTAALWQVAVPIAQPNALPAARHCVAAREEMETTVLVLHRACPKDLGRA